LKRVITISANVEGRVASEVLSDVKTRLASFELPNGYTIKFTGKTKSKRRPRRSSAKRSW